MQLRLGVTALAALALIACDDGAVDEADGMPPIGVDGGGGEGGEGGAGGEGGQGGSPGAASLCDVQRQVFAPLCTQCHNGSVNALDLRGDDVAERLVDQPGLLFDDYGLVVPGSPEQSLLYLKAAGTQPADAGGVMPPTGAAPADALAILEGWIADGADPVCDEAPPPVAETVALSTVERAIRASMAIRGLRPSLDELDRVAADPTALEELVDAWLETPAFARTIKDLHDDHLMVRSKGGLLFPPWPPLDQLPERERDVSAINTAIMEAPLELISWVVSQDRPYTDILTTDVVLANRTMQGFWGEPYRIQGVDLGLDCEEGEVEEHPGWSRCRWVEQGRGGAGVLSSGAFFLRWQSAAGNLHRGRANAVSTAFLCYDFLANDISLDGVDIDFADPAVVADAVRESPACASCHDSLDPLSSFFFGYRGRLLFNQIEQQSWPLPWYVPPFAYRDGGPVPRNGRTPALFGRPGVSLADLGRLITEHPDFAPCTVRRFYAYLSQTPLESVPDDLVDDWADGFVDSGWQAKTLVKTIVLSDAFAVSHAVGEPGSEDVIGLKKIRAGQARRAVEELTGVRWQALFDFELNSGGIYGLVDLIDDAIIGYKVLAGGTDGIGVLEEAHTFNAPMAAFWATYATEAAGAVVDADFAVPAAERRLLTVVEPDTQDEDVVRGQIAQLHLQLLGEVVEPGDPAVSESLALLAGAFERSGEAPYAWKVLLTAMLQDARFTHY